MSAALIFKIRLNDSARLQLTSYVSGESGTLLSRFWLLNINYKLIDIRTVIRTATAHTSRERFHGRMNVKHFLIFIEAETLKV